jgi:riboflavin kinase / FMN adenylyltransferase
MRVVHDPAGLERRPRAIAIGTFDGVHRGHRAVLQAAIQAGGTPTAVTFDPHPRVALGNFVPLLATLERRLELIAAAGVEEALVVPFDLDVARLEPEEFAAWVFSAIGAETIHAGPDFRFGRGRAGDLDLLTALGFDVRPVELVPGVSSTAIRHALQEGEVVDAARMLGRPPELDGVVVTGDARGGTLGFPTANLAVPAEILVPRFGIYAGSAAGHRAAVSIGLNPHYGGEERRIEAFLLDFSGDLYGSRLVVELWQRLRDERAFSDEDELVAQIARDVEAARAAGRPG